MNDRLAPYDDGPEELTPEESLQSFSRAVQNTARAVGKSLNKVTEGLRGVKITAGDFNRHPMIPELKEKDAPLMIFPTTKSSYPSDHTPMMRDYNRRR